VGCSPFTVWNSHPLHLAGFDRRTETIIEKRGVSTAPSVIVILVETL
jgi:hypothetical protein